MNYRASEQERVIADYATTLKKDKKLIDALHTFFTPSSVPEGLTDEEVHVCVNLSQLREIERNAMVKKAVDLLEKQKTGMFRALSQQSLPRELLPGSGKMTRYRFRRGIIKYLASLPHN
jgi:hypothetical protein